MSTKDAGGLPRFSAEPKDNSKGKKDGPTEYPDNRWFTTHERDSNFATIRWCLGFTDKSLFLEEMLMHQARVVYVTAPARFGKSTLLSMADIFFRAEYSVSQGDLKEKDRFHTDAFEMFKDLKINTEKAWFVKKHFHKYVVVELNFKPLLRVFDYTSFKYGICKVLSRMVKPYLFLLECEHVSKEIKKFIRDYYQAKNKRNCFNLFEREDPLEAPEEFCRLLQETFGLPLMVIGDEYDSYLQAVIKRNILDFDRINSDSETFVGSIGKSEGRARQAVAKVYLTGTLNLGGLMSGLCNTMEHKDFFYNEAIARFYGLTQEEVKSLLANFSMVAQYKTVEENFDGYAVLNSELRLFNIPSVINYIQTQNLKPFISRQLTNQALWDNFDQTFSDYRLHYKTVRSLDTNKETNVLELLKIEKLDGVQYKNIIAIKKVVQKSWSKPYFLSPFQTTIFFTYLIESGLYTVVKENDFYRWIRPTNEESRQMLLQHLSNCEYSSKRYNMTESLRIELEDAVREMDGTPESCKRFGNATFKTFEDLPPNSEADYKSVIVTAFRSVAAQDPHLYKFQAEIAMQMTTEGLEEAKKKNPNATGEGKIDFIFVNIRTGFVIIFEFKFEKGAGPAFNQLFMNRYFDILETHPEYKSLKINSKTHIGMSLTRKGTISMKFVNNNATIAEAETYRRMPKFTRLPPEKNWATTGAPKM